MGEYAAKFRPEIDLDEFERRLRAAAPAPQPESPPPAQAARKDDPLAELARLVGGDAANRGRDPFEALFRAQAAIADIRHAPEPQAPHEPYFEPQAQRAPAYGQAQAAPAAAPQQSYAADAQQYREAEPQWIDEAPEASYRQAPAASYDQAPAASYDPARRAEAAQSGGRRKVFYGIAAVLALGVVGIGATLGLRGKSGEKDVVTIQANSDPAKVKPAQSETSGASNNQTLFDRKDNSVAGAKVVGGAEQPADLGASAKAAKAAVPPPPAVVTSQDSPFPSPKKVKTVQVRADGSVIQGQDARPSMARGLPSMAGGFPANGAAAPAAHAPAAKTTERATPTTEAALKTPAKTPANAAKTPANAAKPAATEAAGEAGGFAVQLSGTPSEAEARDAASALSTKYAGALKGRHASFVKAQVGDKTVYRVRVGHLTEATAKDMCAAIKGQGGTCFVAKN
jgi:hypothetical protein